MATFVSSLSPYQFAFNGFIMGAGTKYAVTNVDGLTSLPPLRVQDDNRGYNDGAYSGRDFYDGRVVTLDITIVGDSTYSAQYYYNQLQQNLYPQQYGTPSALGAFQFELSTSIGLKVMYGRVRNIVTALDPEFTYGYIQTAVEFYFPDPRYYDYPSTTSTGTTVSVSNNGWATSCPVITIASPTSQFWIANGTASGSAYMQFNPISTSYPIIIDLLQKTVVQNNAPVRGIFTGGNWLSIPPITSSYTFYSLGYAPGGSGSAGPSMSIVYSDSYV